MHQIQPYKVAFIGWNPFQLIHIHDLAKQIPNSVFILEQRINNNLKYFSEDLLQNIQIPIIYVKEKELLTLDTQYDIIIVQTYFNNLQKFTHSKIVMLQYGYAKEPHNYGVWRALASLIITYGEYAKEKVLPYAPALALGNPRYDKWHTPEFHKNVQTKYPLSFQHSKTILYMPTWGDLSSFSYYIESIISLSSFYNILIKIHHNSEFFEKKKIKENPNIYIFGANDDNMELLSLSNIVLSDYSGAIFDAFYCKKQIVLLDLPIAQLQKSKKIDQYSLEFSQRNLLGTSISTPQILQYTIHTLLNQPHSYTVAQKKLYQTLFTNTINATQSTIEALHKLMQKHFPKTQSQSYIQQMVITSYNKKCISDMIIEKLKKLYKLIKH
jgi:hypothetical protein